MDQHNRKSYLGPPAPKSLRDAHTSSSASNPPSATSDTSRDTYSNPNSAEIPSQVPKDPSPRFPYVPSHRQPRSPASGYARYPGESPVPGFRDLSLGNENNGYSSAPHRPRHRDEPQSAISAPKQSTFWGQSTLNRQKPKAMLPPGALANVAPAPPASTTSTSRIWRGQQGETSR